MRNKSMGSRKEQIHVMFLPFIAPGHMMPMVDIARLFAANGVKVTIILTTLNALKFSNAIHRDSESGRSISLHILRFPSLEAGLPEGCENLCSTNTREMSIKLLRGLEIMEPEITSIFRKHSPDCIASDYLFPWTVDIASELGIPRLAFSGSGFFNLCIANSLETCRPHINISSETQPFVVPGLPDEVKLTRSQLPDIVKGEAEFSWLFDKLKDAEKRSFGVLMNSFYELEPAYSDHFAASTGIRTWHLGPVSMINKNIDDQVDRGDNTSVSTQSCLSWLDSKKPNSVLYVCFGSLVRFRKAQISEIASALEGSGHCFVWVVGKALKGDDTDDQEWWLPETYEARMKEKNTGLIIKGWAPQLLILEHPAIGGFLTHCGWNSILEGICAGIPMVTWPIFAEQFYNEKLVTQVIKFGASVGNEMWKVWALDESPVLISRDKIENAVKKVMDETNEAKKMRERVRRLAELAKEAVQEGGSSYNDLKVLIEDITMYKHANAAAQS